MERGHFSFPDHSLNSFIASTIKFQLSKLHFQKEKPFQFELYVFIPKIIISLKFLLKYILKFMFNWNFRSSTIPSLYFTNFKDNVFLYSNILRLAKEINCIFEIITVLLSDEQVVLNIGNRQCCKSATYFLSIIIEIA